MSAYQIVLRSTAFRGISLAGMYARFLDWWVSLYANPPRNPRPML